MKLLVVNGIMLSFIFFTAVCVPLGWIPGKAGQFFTSIGYHSIALAGIMAVIAIVLKVRNKQDAPKYGSRCKNCGMAIRGDSDMPIHQHNSSRMCSDGFSTAEWEDEYSFCESVYASAISPWCIRPLTEAGRKVGGGVDTGSLCGRVKCRQGWDINVPVASFERNNACKKCVAIYQSGTAKQEDK